MITRVTKEGEPLVKKTVEGGIAIRLTNKTGAASVRGTIVVASTGTDNAFSAAGVDSDMPIGIVYDVGVVDGSECWVVVYGIAQVLLKDATAATRGYWVKVSDTAGRADATTSVPPGGTVGALEEHMQEVGHCIESKTSGTNVLSQCVIHFN